VTAARKILDPNAPNDPSVEAAFQAVPDTMVAEILDGELHTMPRPARPHTKAASVLGGELHGPFRRGKGGPGGWVILDEPELHLDDEVLVPDLAAWRRERLPSLPDAAFISVAPDWVCEVLSPSTEVIDRADKLPLYAEYRVGHVWLLDPALKTLEVFQLDGATYRLLHTSKEAQRVRAEPFAAMELDLSVLWQP
jgi:Uma2 family endonuclease